MSLSADLLTRVGRRAIGYSAVAVSSVILLAGCSFFTDRYAVKTEDGKLDTLGKQVDTWVAQVAKVSEQTAAEQEQKPAVSVDQFPDSSLRGMEVANVYRRAYELIDDPVAKNHILQRLAAIDLKTAENLEVAGLIPQSDEAYRVAIDAYSQLLDDGDSSLNRDELLYALSKAYALTGDAEQAFVNMSKLVDQYPESVYWHEAQFRRGEHLFVRGNYDRAENVFSSLVVGQSDQQDASITNSSELESDLEEVRGRSEEFQSNAVYMLAWSQFKNSRYDEAIRSFVRLLDRRTSADVSQYDYNSEVQRLFEVGGTYVLGERAFTQTDKLTDDALRAISLSLAYSPLDSSIEQLNVVFSDKTYAHWIYADLAEMFFSQERFKDSAVVYAAYEQTHGQNGFAPWFARQSIAVLQHASFTAQAWEQKALFADRYHPLKSFYHNQQARVEVINYLESQVLLYIDELASFEHARARLISASSGGQREPRSRTSESAFDVYQRAAYWYQQKISGYPEHPELGSTYFLLGESLAESGRIPGAIEAYELAAYGGFGFADTDTRYEQANEAGYAAILGYRLHIEMLSQDSAASPDEKLSRWRVQKIESSMLFAETFPKDSRRNPVLASVVNDLQADQNWARLITVADTLLAPGLDIVEPEYSVPTLLASAAAAYELTDYINAEQRYADAIALLNSGSGRADSQRRFLQDARDRELATTIDNYASSIYRQAEIANEAGDKDEAIKEFERLVALAPSSQLRVSAQRNSIILLAEQENWGMVQTAIPQFLADFPGHSDTTDMQKRLLNAHVALEDWRLAALLASELALQVPKSAGVSTPPDANTTAGEAEDLRYAAADYALKAGDKNLAIDQYKKIIANTRRIDESLYEAHYRLASLYQQVGDEPAKLDQYRRIASLQPDDAQRSARSNYIVAEVHSVFAARDFESYQRRRIEEPLVESLNRKREALEKAIAAYDTVESYAVEQFALLATQRKAQIYADFASAIMNSERPANLDELALEEYEFLLEEQAYPFEEQAIELYEVNVQRAWQGMKSPAIATSYQALAELLPARYNKQEILE